MEYNSKNLLNKFDLTGNIWLVSFGDLLTLVLCFFISVISLSPLNPERKIPAKHGTELAHINKNIQAEMKLQHSISLNIFEDELIPLEVGVSKAAIERIKTQVSPAGYKVKELKVETCWRPGESDLTGSWTKSTGLLNGIRRQINDAMPGVNLEKVLFRALASNCEANAAARLTLEF